jgi:ATP-dependent Clp protease ATP-binding subunit ClpX
LPILTYLEPLGRDALKEVLMKPKNALIKQYRKLFQYENIELNFTDEALDLIVDKAVEFNLGARGLRSICEAVMTDAMYEFPSLKNVKELKIDAAYVQEKLSKEKLHKLKVA